MFIEKRSLDLSTEDVLMDHITPDTLFFDIETTGFSPDASHLYMIGISYLSDHQFLTVQWIDETGTSQGEAALLRAFSEAISRFHTCISFNGSTFDFPYLEKKFSRHHMTSPLTHLHHLDIYKLIRPFKEAFQLPDLKQKSVETFLGIQREDIYSGGELIPVYKKYITHPSDQLYETLMLHNHEDLKGMLLLTPLLAYIDVFNQPHQVLKIFQTDETLTLRLSCHPPVPKPITFRGKICTLEAMGTRLSLNIPIYRDTLKYFYPDYKNYYYLPYEDTAIHKSVASYVAPEYRVKATRDNCYTKKSGSFIPQFQSQLKPAYKETASSKITYIDLEMMLNDSELRSSYVVNLLSSFGI